MNQRLKTIFLLLAIALSANAQHMLDSIKTVLLNAPVQEKIYLHLDNQCYFKGDTIWYKAYVVRADSLTYTDKSRILYVELVSPDGMVVERQNLIASEKGYGDGNFVLEDSIYSGFYELRAYTRWMLNFCVSEHDYGKKDEECFYDRQMAKDFFRQFDAVYSRVVPVYERPEVPGDYSAKYIVSRPKTRQDKELKEELIVNFYPEGGHIMAGQPCTVAFEAVNEEGEAQDVSGWLKVPGRTDSIRIATTHQGRGLFTVDVPADGRLRASFMWHDKRYTFNLPRIERYGCALHLDAVGDQLKADIRMVNAPADDHYGVAVLCRGVLKYFETITGSTVLTIDRNQLATGVCNLIVIDEIGQPLCDRLFFVNRHDLKGDSIVVDEGQKIYSPFEQIDLSFLAPEDAHHISISVRDGATDEPTYDTGNVMTDLLLSSELKGFVAYPDYYFESDDREHRQNLDLLLMVQGWRRYNYKELTNGQPLRYLPEKNMTVEGCVYPTIETNEYQPDEVRYWANGVFGYSPSLLGDIDAPQYLVDELMERVSQTKKTSDAGEGSDTPEPIAPGMVSSLYKESNGVLNIRGVNSDEALYQLHGGLDYEVTVEGELVYGKDVATVQLETDHGGHFLINVPPYYGNAIFFLSARDTDISEKKLRRISRKGLLDEEAYPEYYVKRDLFYPVFAKKYNFYQTHQPEEQDAMATLDELDLPEIERISKMDTQLKDVSVKGRRRRGRRRVDYTKPACVYDAQELYNLVTDRGLSFGMFSPREFPFQVSMALLGNYNSDEKMHVMARQNDGSSVPYVFWRNYGPCETFMEQFKSDFSINEDLRLARQDEIRMFTDFDLRNEDKDVPQQTCVPDVILDYMLFDCGAKTYTYRDRRLILPGMYDPYDFYHPNYSQRPLPDDLRDYRRTLYWNPNAPLNADGTFTCTFYNNSKQTRIKVSAVGITDSGTPIYNKSK